MCVNVCTLERLQPTCARPLRLNAKLATVHLLGEVKTRAALTRRETPEDNATTSVQKEASVLPFAQSSATPDVLRTMLQQLVHEIITTEFSEEIGAARSARSPDRRDVRNGYRNRLFRTRVGTLELRIPRGRSVSFSRRCSRAINAANKPSSRRSPRRTSKVSVPAT